MRTFGPRLAEERYHKGLPRLLTAQAPADLADWLDFVALGGLLVFHWDVGPIALAWLAFALGLPYVLVGPFMGRLVDMLPLRTALVASNVGRAVATSALIFPDTVPILLALVFLRGCADSAFTPARQTAIQRLAPPDVRNAANGLSHAINQAAKIAGPALGGLLLTVIDAQSVFLVSAAVSLVAALLLWTLPRQLDRQCGDAEDIDIAPRTASPPTGAWRLVRSRPRLFLAIGLMSAGYFAMFFYDALIPLLTRALGYSEGVFGAAIAAVGAGGVSGAVLLAAVNEGRAFSRMAAGYLVSGVIVCGLGAASVNGFDQPALVFICLFGILGFSSALTVVPYRTVLQNETPADKMGRVSALGEAISTTALLAAPFAGGALAELLGVGVAFLAGGIGLMVLALIASAGSRKLG